MRAKFVFIALFACALSASAPAPSDALAGQQNLMLQRSTEISAATKRKPKKPVPQGTPYVRRGFADPSFGPDGKPYKVPAAIAVVNVALPPEIFAFRRVTIESERVRPRGRSSVLEFVGVSQVAAASCLRFPWLRNLP